jgi:hypothetical protein
MITRQMTMIFKSKIIIWMRNSVKLATKGFLNFLQMSSLMNLLGFSNKELMLQLKGSLTMLLIALCCLVLSKSLYLPVDLISKANSTNCSSKAILKETHTQMNRWRQSSPTTGFSVVHHVHSPIK